MEPWKQIFPEQAALKDMGMCVFCKVATGPGDFRNPISLREFEISGMCQTCQDEIFGTD